MWTNEELQLLPWLRPLPPGSSGWGQISPPAALQIRSLPKLCPAWKIKASQHKINNLQFNHIKHAGFNSMGIMEKLNETNIDYRRTQLFMEQE